jgi:hypothetical protein
MTQSLMRAAAALTRCCFSVLAAVLMAMVHSTSLPKPSKQKPYLPVNHVGWLLLLLLLLLCQLLQHESGVELQSVVGSVV